MTPRLAIELGVLVGAAILVGALVLAKKHEGPTPALPTRPLVAPAEPETPATEAPVAEVVPTVPKAPLQRATKPESQVLDEPSLMARLRDMVDADPVRAYQPRTRGSVDFPTVQTPPNERRSP